LVDYKPERQIQELLEFTHNGQTYYIKQQSLDNGEPEKENMLAFENYFKKYDAESDNDIFCDSPMDTYVLEIL
jgi:hypothetical protein